jgi:hypothetical protein
MPAEWPQSPLLEWSPTKTWQNWHHTLSQDIDGIYVVRQVEGDPAARIKAAATEIQRAVAASRGRGKRIRAAGSAWSLSRAGVTDGVMLDTSRLKGWTRINAGNLDPGYAGGADKARCLAMFECGTLVAEVNARLESDVMGCSLWTSGAANGQTIVGAASTNTHGSALSFGALHDQIVAIHLLAGPEKNVLLERETYPVLKPAFAAALGAQLMRDDDLFNAVLVGFGSFGIILNVVIEARPRFLLRAETHAPVANDADLRALIASLDPEAHPRLRGKGRPYFLQVVLNPHSNDALINAMYELQWRDGYVPDYSMKETKIGPGYDGLTLVGAVLQLFPGAIPAFFKLAQGTVDTKTRIASRGELFSYKAPQTKVASGSLAVDVGDALRALDLLFDLNRRHPAPLVFGCRFVRPSPALLAFTRFPTTMVISMDGVFNDQSLAFFQRAAETLEAKGIAYTQHWGKVNAYDPQRLRRAYGANLDRWIAARHALLPDPIDRATFTNPFMSALGLDS